MEYKKKNGDSSDKSRKIRLWLLIYTLHCSGKVSRDLGYDRNSNLCNSDKQDFM